MFALKAWRTEIEMSKNDDGKEKQGKTDKKSDWELTEHCSKWALRECKLTIVASGRQSPFCLHGCIAEHALPASCLVIMSPVSHQSCSCLSPSFSYCRQEMKYPLLCLAGMCVMWGQMAAKRSIWECLHIIELQLLFLPSEVMGGFPAATRSRWAKRDMSWWGGIKTHWDGVCSVPLQALAFCWTVGS